MAVTGTVMSAVSIKMPTIRLRSEFIFVTSRALNFVKNKISEYRPASIYEREEKTAKTKKAHSEKGQALA